MRSAMRATLAVMSAWISARFGRRGRPAKNARTSATGSADSSSQRTVGDTLTRCTTPPPFA